MGKEGDKKKRKDVINEEKQNLGKGNEKKMSEENEKIKNKEIEERKFDFPFFSAFLFIYFN